MLKSTHYQRGMTLLELLLATALALVLLASLVATFAAAAGANADYLKHQRARDALRGSVELMAAELRRAGGWQMPLPATDDVLTANPFQQPDAVLRLGAASDCILFSYDDNHNGRLDPFERRGFRLRAGAIEYRKAGRGCAQPGWEQLTVADDLQIRTLRFAIDHRELNEQLPLPRSRRLVSIEVLAAPTALTLTIRADELRIQRRVSVANDVWLKRSLP